MAPPRAVSVGITAEMAGEREEVLVVRREEIFAGGIWQGLKTSGLDRYHELLRSGSFFKVRDEVEEDPSHQQIIPYVVFRHRDRYLLTRRLQGSSESRLRQLRSLGIGGHINPGDRANGDPVGGSAPPVEGGEPVLEGLRREWEEEVDYRGGFETSLIGLLKDDSSPVSQVHLGVVFLAQGDSPEITIREEEKLSGELLTLEEIRPLYSELETWSQIVYDHLKGEARLAPTGGL